ncbi:F-box only protein 7-like isoform X2 [Physella acuta]|uniref:F-box only protein 7-like isoform X2 n=1 Tax=Physella acuta TaxID=109671 RepID=UPI0027DD00D3|nr:F-box only protein 7-like isoform X2 [Physella acuta]
MKVRVKFDRETRIIDLGTREASDITLLELKTSVSSQINLNDHSFQLSLNGRDGLLDENQKLSEIGIVSGDLLHIMGTNITQNNERPPEPTRNRPQPLASYTSDTALSSVLTTGQISVTTSTTDPSTSQLSTPLLSTHNIQSEMEVNVVKNSSPTPVIDADVNRYLQEPLVIRESTATQVPTLLHQLYTSANCSSTNDALWVVLHAIMLEAGFYPSQDQDLWIMPSEWKKQGFYTCSYSYTVTPDVVKDCALIGLTMGSSVAVHALTKSEQSYKTEHLQLRTADFIRNLSEDPPQTYRALDRLSRQMMDTVCLPLIDEIVTESGFPGRSGILALPYAAKLKIFSFLDAKSLCHMGQTCLDFFSVYKDKIVWRLLYMRQFGKPEDCSLGKNWFELYKEKYQQQKDEQRRRMFQVDATDPPWGFPGAIGPFRPFAPGMPPFPRMLGGDYDLHPEFAAGLPDPLAGRFTGPLAPNVPMPSPFSTGHRFDPLARPNRGNLTGSPFANGFHGQFF